MKKKEKSKRILVLPKKEKLRSVMSKSEAAKASQPKREANFLQKHGMTISEYMSKKKRARISAMTREEWIKWKRDSRAKPVAKREFATLCHLHGKHIENLCMRKPRKMIHRNFCSGCQGSGEWRQGTACNRCEGSGWEPT